ncbi:hypothetical protein SprV_0200609700 [Sparganum proliferum]
MQRIVDFLAVEFINFDLTINRDKTAVMHQPSPNTQHCTPARITVNGHQLETVDNFAYLGSTLSNGTRTDDGVTQRIPKVNSAFVLARHQVPMPTSLSHSACSVEPSVGSEETSSWQGGMGKHHNRSIKPQTTPVDLLRPSAVKAAGNRTNEPLDRQHCVVVHGLSESNAPTPKERMSADLDMFQHLLNKMLDSNEKVTIRAAFRIGKKESEQSETVRPRPLKIVLGSKEEASVLLFRKSSLRNSQKEVFSAGLFSSGTSETPRISGGVEEETCSGREQLGYFQGTSDTEECDVALEPASHHDGGSNIILANPRQIERITVE